MKLRKSINYIKVVESSSEYLSQNDEKPCPCCNRLILDKKYKRNISPNKQNLCYENHHYHHQDSLTITKVIAEDWLLKKGSGNDFLGSTVWKGRYVKLALTKIHGYDVDVPTLLVYWSSFSLYPSTYISLASKIVIPVDFKESDDTNSFLFHIVPTKNDCNKQNESNFDDPNNISYRTFMAPKLERNSWFILISNSIKDFEKRRFKCRKEKALWERKLKYKSQLPPSHPRSRVKVNELLLEST